MSSTASSMSSTTSTISSTLLVLFSTNAMTSCSVQKPAQHSKGSRAAEIQPASCLTSVSNAWQICCRGCIGCARSCVGKLATSIFRSLGQDVESHKHMHPCPCTCHGAASHTFWDQGQCRGPSVMHSCHAKPFTAFDCEHGSPINKLQLLCCTYV